MKDDLIGVIEGGFEIGFGGIKPRGLVDEDDALPAFRVAVDVILFQQILEHREGIKPIRWGFIPFISVFFEGFEENG